MKKLFSKKKLVVFIVCFLSAIFMLPISLVNALGQSIPPVCQTPFNDDFIKANVFNTSYFTYPYVEHYNQLVDYYNENLKNSYDSYIIYAQTVNWMSGVGNFEKPSLLFFNLDDVVSDFYLTMDNRYSVANTSIKLDFNKKPNRLSFDTNGNIVVGTYYSTSWGFQSYLPLTDFANFSYMIETNFDRPLILSPQSYNKTIIYKEQLYNSNDVILPSIAIDKLGGDADINPKDNLKGIYNYSAKNIVDLDYVEYNFVVDLDSEEKFLFYLKDSITKIKTKDFDSFELSYRLLNADINDPFIYIDTFSTNDKYSFIKTRNINFNFIEFYFEDAEYHEDLYFLNDLVDRVEFKIKLIPKDNTKIQNLHLYDAYETYNPSLDYYFIPKSWKVNNKNYTFDYFTTGYIKGAEPILDNLKEINIPIGINKVFLYSNVDTLSTVIGYDLTDKRRLYNYSLSEQKIISPANDFEILDSFNTKWQNLYKIEKNIYNNEIFYLELLDLHSLGYTLWVSHEVEYSFFNDKTITIKNASIDIVSNPDRQEIEIDNDLSHFKRGFNAINILYGTFYNNLTSEFKFLHNFLITLIILSVVLWVVML